MGEESVSGEKKKVNRVMAILLIALGAVLGVTWNSAKLCIGDSIFNALGLPAWSNGTNGTHYPAVIGSFTVLIGVGILNYTLEKKARFWVWTIVILLLIILNMVSVFI